MPRPYNIVRKLVDEAFARTGMTPRVVAESRVGHHADGRDCRRPGLDHPAGLDGARFRGLAHAWQSRIVEPVIEAPLALCQSDHLPLSEPAQAVRRSCSSWSAIWPAPSRPPRNPSWPRCRNPRS
jgi:LysR family nitrogen assimilation transcriptional regulator